MDTKNILESLTEKENETLGYIMEGLSNSEIAERMGISISGVKFHIHQMLEKTGTKNKCQLIIFFTNWPKG